MSFMALVGVSGLIVGGDAVILVMSALFIVFAGLFVYRALRLELRAEEEGLYVRGALGTRLYEWSELRGADVVPGSIFFRTWYLRVFREGRRPLRLPDLSEFALAAKVDSLAISEMARHIDRRVRAAGGRPVE